MSETEGGGTTRRRGSSPAAPGFLPDDDDLLREILLRLPPQPSSLPRASAVCKRWRRLVADPKFLKCFRTRHRKPPLLGVFQECYRIAMTPTLDPPDRIPPVRFSLRDGDTVLGCRHGRVLLTDCKRKEVSLCDPITGEQLLVAVPLEFQSYAMKGAVLCVAADQGHVHGSCHSSPFKVVLMCPHSKDLSQLMACVYSSET